MYFYPRNRFLHIEVSEEKAEDNVSSTLGGFVLPPEYKGQGAPLKVVKLLCASKESEYVKDEGSFLLVPTHNIETVEFEGMKVSVVPEHVVYGIVVKVK